MGSCDLCGPLFVGLCPHQAAPGERRGTGADDPERLPLVLRELEPPGQRKALDAYYTRHGDAEVLVHVVADALAPGWAPPGRGQLDAPRPGVRLERHLGGQARGQLALLEPSAGDGAWVQAAQALGASVLAVDLDPQARGLLVADTAMAGDFLALEPFGGGWCVDAVVGNPPYAQDTGRRNAKGGAITEPVAELHARHALRWSQHVFFLLRAAFLEADERRAFWQEHPCRHVWFARQRMQFVSGGSNQHLMALFWWDQLYDGPTTCSHVDLRGGA